MIIFLMLFVPISDYVFFLSINEDSMVLSEIWLSLSGPLLEGIVCLNLYPESGFT